MIYKNTTILTGKYRGRTYEDIFKSDYSYFKSYASRIYNDWIMTGDDPEQVGLQSLNTEVYGRLGAHSNVIFESEFAKEYLSVHKLKMNANTREVFKKLIHKYPSLAILLGANQWGIDNIKVSIDSNLISFIKNGRVEQLKPGKFLKMLLSTTDLTVENEWMEAIASFVKTVGNLTDFVVKIFEGPDVHKYYDYRNYYSQKNTLGRSCMKRGWRLTSAKWYGVNDVKLLTLYHKDTDTIGARALLWDDITFSVRNGRNVKIQSKMMDRVYTINNNLKQYLIRWAQDNGYFYRKNFSVNDNRSFIDPSQKEIELIPSFKEKNDDYSRPWFDTVKINFGIN